MTSINNQDDFLRALRDNPEWREAVRAQILGEDLLKLPGKFDAFREDMTTFMERTDRRLGLLEDGQRALQDGQGMLQDGQKALQDGQGMLQDGQKALQDGQRALQDGQKAFEDGQKVLQDGQKAFEDGQKVLQDGQKALEDGQKVFQDEQQSIRRDLAPIKGFHAQNAAARESRDIARAVNCRQTALMDRDWLEFLVDNGDAPGVSPGDLASFQKADMVIRARSRENGQTVYLPVEASFTARSHDFDRAARNARLLGQFTNETAIPVVASHTLSSEVRGDILQAIENGAMRWFQIDQRYMEPD